LIIGPAMASTLERDKTMGLVGLIPDSIPWCIGCKTISTAARDMSRRRDLSR
jgi:hypothetical protein